MVNTNFSPAHPQPAGHEVIKERFGKDVQCLQSFLLGNEFVLSVRQELGGELLIFKRGRRDFQVSHIAKV